MCSASGGVRPAQALRTRALATRWLLQGQALHQRGGGDAQFDLAAHQPVRHAVVVAVELDVVVDVDLGRFQRAIEALAGSGRSAGRPAPRRRCAGSRAAS
jgi:hypothetical protein